MRLRKSVISIKLLRCGLTSFISLFLYILSSSVLAAQISPFATTNYSPLVHIFGLPPIPDANLLTNERGRWSIREDQSSHFAASSSGNELALFDGESRRTTLSYFSSEHEEHQWQINIPYIEYNGGDLDGFIEGWHSLLNLPKGSRDKFERDALRYYYTRDASDGVPELDIQNPQSGIGDILLISQWKVKYVQHNSSSRHSLFASLKLPTGNDDALLGSGSVDVSFGFAGNETFRIYDYHGQWFLSSGLLFPGSARYLASYQNDVVFFGGLGAGLSVSKSLVAKAQLDGHSAFYSGTQIAEVGQEALQLTLGGEFIFERQLRVDIGLSEDLVVNASPDITLHLGFYSGF